MTPRTKASVDEVGAGGVDVGSGGIEAVSCAEEVDLVSSICID